MPFRERKLQLHSFCAPNRDSQASCLPIEPIGLVLRLEQEASDKGDGCGFAFVKTPSMDFQDPQRDLKGRVDVLFVEGVLAAEVRVRHFG